jgi:hypothetical protein
VTADIPLAAPAGLTAAKSGTNQITISWSAVPGAVSYGLQRRHGPIWDPLITVNGTQFVDSGLPADTTYAYRVYANPSSPSVYSNVDVATTTEFIPVQSGSRISYTDFDKLLQTVNAVRAASGWPAVTWQNIISPNSPLPAPGSVITAQHLIALRSRMNEALQSVGAGISGYTDADPQLQIIKAVHINELQQRAQ